MTQLRDRSVLVVHSDAWARRATLRAMAATGASCQDAADVAGALTKLQQGPVDLIVVDWAGLPVTHQLGELNSLATVVLLADRPVFERHSDDIQGPPLCAMLISGVVAVQNKPDAAATRELVTTAAKTLSGDIFGLDKYLGWGSCIHRANLQSSAEVESAVDAISDVARDCGLTAPEVSSLGLVSGELISNAIWDAPADSEGRPKYAASARTKTVQLDNSETVQVEYASDGIIFGLGVTDNFGRLDHRSAVHYIHKCFGRDNNRRISRQSGGGAGLGLYLAYQSVSSLIINVNPGVRTEVIGLVRFASASQASAARSLCYFNYQNTEPQR